VLHTEQRMLWGVPPVAVTVAVEFERERRVYRWKRSKQASADSGKIVVVRTHLSLVHFPFFICEC
jgi:hypothetical protein